VRETKDRSLLEFVPALFGAATLEDVIETLLDAAQCLTGAVATLLFRPTSSRTS